jgi:hypothetical protein
MHTHLPRDLPDMKPGITRLAWAVLVVTLFSSFSLAQIDALRRGFASPPDEARPWVYWMWMDGNLSREGITADLEAMKRAGIGGVVICEVSVGVPRGKVDFMSKEWRQLFKHVVREAERLGLQITLNAGPGWTGSGGPWVKPEQSMQHVVGSDTTIVGPSHFDAALPRPARRPAFFGDGVFPPDLEKAKNAFYQDVAVLAYPSAENGPRIKDIDERALYIRAPYSSQPHVRSYLPMSTGYPLLPSGSAIDPGRMINLTDRLTPDGRLSWDVPDGRWTIFRFGHTSTGANTRPAPRPGLGLECDKLDTAALNSHFENYVVALLREIGRRNPYPGPGWTFLHIDSWEMGSQNWTGAFRSEFERRCGYDLLPYLPAVTGRIVESHEITERFLWDLRQTVNELVLENHAQHLKDLAYRNGFHLSIEPYDMTPCADMSLGSIADVPMCEFWLYGFNTYYSVLEATSIAHTIGKTVVAAEAFTSLEEEAWKAYPGSMKALGDWAFSAGVNRIVFHRHQHQPWRNVKPGMTMGPFGVHWERTQTWWDMVPAYHRYLSRCQFVLRQGLPVADVCYLVAEGAPHVFQPPSSAVRNSPPDRLGYNFDGCAPDVFVKRMSVSEGILNLPDGMSYRVLVLPEQRWMTLPLLRKVRQLVADGATIIGPPPRKSPGLADYPRCDEELMRMSADLWGESDGRNITEHRFGKGRVIWVDTTKTRLDADSLEEQYGDFATVTAVLAGMGVEPDFESEIPLRYTHRRDRETDIYFLANPSDRPISTKCVFRVTRKRAERWDPVTGGVCGLDVSKAEKRRSLLNLDFEPHQSCFVIFSNSNGVECERNTGGVAAKSVVVLDGPWTVRFDPKWGGPKKTTFSQLDDWSRRPETGIKYYSGIATYMKLFDASPGIGGKVKPGRHFWLDLGTVHNMARVRLNGKDLGVVWCDPWKVDVSAALRAKGNKLEIQVANLWPNRLIGDEQLPEDCKYGKGGYLAGWPEWFVQGRSRPEAGRYTFTTWKHYTKDSPLLPSGLLGPVKVVEVGD